MLAKPTADRNSARRPSQCSDWSEQRSMSVFMNYPPRLELESPCEAELARHPVFLGRRIGSVVWSRVDRLRYLIAKGNRLEALRTHFLGIRRSNAYCRFIDDANALGEQHKLRNRSHTQLGHHA